MKDLDQILKKVKDEIFPTLVEMVDPEEISQLGIPVEVYADIIYTHIMTLGFNNGDINASLSDLMPYRNQVIYNGTEHQDTFSMANNFVMIMEDYKHQYWAFKGFWENIQSGMPLDEAMIEVQKILLPLRMD